MLVTWPQLEPICLMLPMSTGRSEEDPLDNPVDEPVLSAHVPAAGGSKPFEGVLLVEFVLLIVLCGGDLPSSRMPQSVSDAAAPVPNINKINPLAIRNIGVPPHAHGCL